MFFEEKIEDINHIFETIVNKKIAVWCLGRHTEKLMEYTTLLKYDVRFFVDKQADSVTKYEVYGRPVYSPKEADFENIDAIVISTYRYQKEILSDLNDMGIADKAVTIYTEKDEGEFYFLPQKNNDNYYFTGNFRCWDDAEKSVTGYEDAAIAQKVLQATKQVMEGKACYERDSILFYNPEFNFRLIGIFGLLVARKNHINILDFGGALGSEYWKNRSFLYKFGTEFTWNVVEQDSYVKLGKEEVSNEELKFYNNINQLKDKIDLVILSGILQYLPDYKSILSQLLDLDAEFILIERQIVSDKSRICVQYVGKNIYTASYPVHILEEKELLDIFMEKYKKVTEFVSEVDPVKAYVDGKEFYYKGYLMERKKDENT